MSDGEAEVERLIALGYAREDIQVLPDGSVTIVPHDELKGTAGAIARATAPARLEKMLAQKKKLDEEYKLHSPHPVKMTSEQIHEYSMLKRSIDAAKGLIAGSGKS